jgi:hypothetical protein
MPPITSPLIPTRNGVRWESLLPDVSEMLSWLANSDEHLVNKPAASSRPVVALICGGAMFEIMKFTPQKCFRKRTCPDISHRRRFVAKLFAKIYVRGRRERPPVAPGGRPLCGTNRLSPRPLSLRPVLPNSELAEEGWLSIRWNQILFVSCAAHIPRGISSRFYNRLLSLSICRFALTS